ncbi:MAG: redoxin domain-containing protein [Chloroflexota bacterium]
MGEESSGRGKPRGLLVLLLIGLVSGLIMAALTILNPQRQAGLGVGQGAPTPVPDLVAVGKPAPDFTAESLDGRTLTLSDLQGSTVAINFWATWCVPCTVEMPALESAALRYANQGLVVLPVNAGESHDKVQDFMETNGLTLPALLDPDGDILDLYAIRYFPTTIWVDADGIVRAEHFGPLTNDQIDQYVTELTGSESG